MAAPGGCGWACGGLPNSAAGRFPARTLGLFSPNEVVTTGMTALPRAYGAGAVDRAGGDYIDRRGACVAGIGRRDDVHLQLALRPDRSPELVAAGGGIARA